MPALSKNRLTAPGGLRPVAMVKTSKSAPASCACNSDSIGISVRQGAHHVAQKFSKITLPFNSETVLTLPSAVVNSASGKAFETL